MTPPAACENDSPSPPETTTHTDRPTKKPRGTKRAPSAPLRAERDQATRLRRPQLTVQAIAPPRDAVRAMAIRLVGKTRMEGTNSTMKKTTNAKTNCPMSDRGELCAGCGGSEAIDGSRKRAFHGLDASAARHDTLGARHDIASTMTRQSEPRVPLIFSPRRPAAI